MAVVNTLSQSLTNYAANPRVLNNPWLAGDTIKSALSIVAAVATDSIGSTYRFGHIKSGAVVCAVDVLNDATTAGVWQIGVYCRAESGANFTPQGGSSIAAGAVPITNANEIFAQSVSTAAAQLTWSNILKPTLLPGATTGATNMQYRIWELLGFTADPFYLFDIVMTATTAPTAAGNIALRWSWYN